jgi:hypothetical protein
MLDLGYLGIDRAFRFMSAVAPPSDLSIGDLVGICPSTAGVQTSRANGTCLIPVFPANLFIATRRSAHHNVGAHISIDD